MKDKTTCLEISVSYLRKCIKIPCNLIIWIIYSHPSLTLFPWRSTGHPIANKTSQNVSPFPMAGGQPTFSYYLGAGHPSWALPPFSLVAPPPRSLSPLLRKSTSLSMPGYCQIAKDCLPEDTTCSWYSISLFSIHAQIQRRKHINSVFQVPAHNRQTKMIYSVVNYTAITCLQNANYTPITTGNRIQQKENATWHVRLVWVQPLPLLTWGISKHICLSCHGDKMITCEISVWYMIQHQINTIFIDGSDIINGIIKFHVICNPMCSH